MPFDTPKYGFNRKPQFSVNHIADYFSCQNATQRTKTVRAAKFPQVNQVSAYSPVRSALQKALTKQDFGRDDLAFLLARIEAKMATEVGQAKNNSRLCAKAVECFMDTFTPRALARCSIVPSPKKLSVNVKGVKINVSLDAMVTETKGDDTNVGGIVLTYAFSADRGPIIDRQATVAGLILWALEGGQMPPLPRLCMSVDLAEKHIVKASASHERFRSKVTDTCEEVAVKWDGVEPPDDYDGPDWR